MKKAFVLLLMSASLFTANAEVTVKDYMELGDSYTRKGDFQKAVSAYQGGLVLDPNNSTLLYKIGDIYFNAKEKERARDFLERAVKADPSNKLAFAELSKLSPGVKQPQESSQPTPAPVVPTKTDAPQDSESIFAAGDKYFKNGLYEEALSTFKRDPKEYYKNLFGAATVSRFLGLYPESIEYYKKLISAKPDFSEAYLGIGISYQLNSNFDSAITNFRKYLEFNKKEEVYSAIANICIKTKKYDIAKQVLEEGISNFGTSEVLKSLLEEVYRK